MEKRDRFTVSLDKRANVKKCEADGIVADSTEIRMALMAQVRNGERTLADVQAELKKIKRNAKKNGQITKNQAFIRG